MECNQKEEEDAANSDLEPDLSEEQPMEKERRINDLEKEMVVMADVEKKNVNNATLALYVWRYKRTPHHPHPHLFRYAESYWNLAI